jgi:hypothetical protein
MSQREVARYVSEAAGDNQGLLEDVFDYESALQSVNRAFHREIDCIRLQQRDAFCRLLKEWDADQAAFASLTISVNPYSYFHESRWKWATHRVNGVSNEKLAELKVIYNLAEEPGCFITAFAPDPETGMTNEFDLDRVSAELIAHFGEGNTLRSLQPMNEIHYHRVRELLHVNLLCIHEQ